MLNKMKTNAERFQRTHSKQHSLRVIFVTLLSVAIILGTQLLIPEHLGHRTKRVGALVIPILLIAALLEFNKLRNRRDE